MRNLLTSLPASAVPYLPVCPASTFFVGLKHSVFDSMLLQLEYCRFIWQLTNHLEDAVAAGTARKAAKREPTSSPGGMDTSGSASASGAGGGGSYAGGECQLQALTSRRGWVCSNRPVICTCLCAV